MSRILHIAQPTSAGVAEVVGNLAVDQLSAGCVVLVACPSDGPPPGPLARAGVPVRAWPATRKLGVNVLAETRHLGRIISAFRPDLVHLHSAKAGLAGRLAVRGRVPTIYQPHAWSFEAVTGPLYRASVAWERFAARWTDLVVCVSEHERRRGLQVGVEAQSVVVPNGVDTSRFRPYDERDRRNTRRLLDLPTGPLAVCVGRLCRQKGQDALLAAWPAVTAALPAARLLLVGGGPDRSRLQALAPPGVTFIGPVADPRLWYAAADVVVLPSRWEAMPLVLLEAMACRRSVVATDVGGVREAMADPDSGIVPVEDALALALALIARLGSPERAAAEGHRNRLQVAIRHDREDLIGKVRALYPAVIATRSDPPVLVRDDAP